MRKTTILCSILLLAACSGQPTKDTGNGSTNNSSTAVTTTNTGTANSTSSSNIGADGSSSVTTTEQSGNSTFNYLPGSSSSNSANDTQDITIAGLNNPNNLLSQRVIYFDYNKSAIRPEYMVLINTHAKLLAKYPALKMRLEGHADERGSREYNVALSAARAQSVKNIMMAQGPRSQQMRTIGFGEEVPVVRGSNQNSWQKNRRVEIKYDEY